MSKDYITLNVIRLYHFEKSVNVTRLYTFNNEQSFEYCPAERFHFLVFLFCKQVASCL